MGLYWGSQSHSTYPLGVRFPLRKGFDISILEPSAQNLLVLMIAACSKVHSISKFYICKQQNVYKLAVYILPQ